jgi:hypothetical protein
MKDLKKNIADEFPEATAVYNAKLFFNTIDGKSRFAVDAITLAAGIAVNGIRRKGLGLLDSYADLKAAGLNDDTSGTQVFELAITGTAVIEKNSKTRRSPRRRN